MSFSEISKSKIFPVIDFCLISIMTLPELIWLVCCMLDLSVSVVCPRSPCQNASLPLISLKKTESKRKLIITTKAKSTNQNSYNQCSKECIYSAMETWSKDTKPVINIVWAANVNSVWVSSFIILCLPDKWTCSYFLWVFFG